jgi:hypothetical protein
MMYNLNVLKNHRNTAAQMKVELNIHIVDPVFIKTGQMGTSQIQHI